MGEGCRGERVTKPENLRSQWSSYGIPSRRARCVWCLRKWEGKEGEEGEEEARIAGGGRGREECREGRLRGERIAEIEVRVKSESRKSWRRERERGKQE